MVVGVVGSVGTAEGEEHARKRKRLEEEPGSSGTLLPSNKKRHIRLRSRVQVSASTSQAPDTQGSSMAKVCSHHSVIMYSNFELCMNLSVKAVVCNMID